MERRPLAYRHLARMHEMVTNASIARVVVERELALGPALERTAAADLATDEEIQALARERDWTLPETKPYQWALVEGRTTVVPRIQRVLARDMFELDHIRRTTDDDEVEALASALYDERRALNQALEEEHPEFSLPGAK